MERAHTRELRTAQRKAMFWLRFFFCWCSEAPASWRSPQSPGQETLLMRVPNRCKWQACSTVSFLSRDWPAARSFGSYISASSYTLRKQLKRDKQSHARGQHQTSARVITTPWGLNWVTGPIFRPPGHQMNHIKSGKWLMLAGQAGKSSLSLRMAVSSHFLHR